MTALGIFDPDLYGQGDPWTAGLPLDAFAALRDERPCYWQPLTDEPMFIDGVWVVTRHADILDMIQRPARFSNMAGTSVRRFDPTIPARGGKPTMVSMDGADHQRNRTVTSRAFSPRAVMGFAERFRAIAAGLVDRALAKGRIDFIADIACLMPLDAVSEMLGIPPDDRQQVLAWTNGMTVPLDPHFTPTPESFLTALNGLWDYGLDLAARRRREPDDSVVTAIAAAHADGRLSDDEVSGYFLQLAAAGNETTRNAIAFGLHALLLRPEQMASLRAQGGEVPASAVEEILRWASPTIYTVRRAQQDIELHGQRIAAGESIALMLASANFDGAVFDRPGDFDVMRNKGDHLAFGAGPHICLGLHVARLEIRILFEELLRRASDIRLDGDVDFVRDSFIHGIRSMPLIVRR